MCSHVHLPSLFSFFIFFKSIDKYVALKKGLNMKGDFDFFFLQGGQHLNIFKVRG